MSRATVRAAIANYLAPPNVPLLNTVYPHAPKIAPGGAWYLAAPVGEPTGVIGYIFLADQTEKRIALGGAHNGRKWRQYQANLVFFTRSSDPDSADVDQANDTFLDALVPWLQADRNLGDPSVIFQAGEGSDGGGNDIRVKTDLPVVLDGGTTQILSVVTLTVAEILNT